MSSLHYCPWCDRGWPSKLASDDCADQCEAEDSDRKSGRMFKMNRNIFPSSD